MPNKYLDSVGLAEYTGLVKDYVDTKADDYLPLAGGTLTGNVYTTPYYDSTIVDPEGGQTLIVSKGKVAKGTAPSSDEWHTMVMAVDNSGSTNNANKYGQIETGVKTDGSVETTVQAYKNEASSTTSAKISVGYDANGNAFTSAPTPTAGDNSTKIATTAFVNTAMANGYLPLSGGTMTGNIVLSGKTGLSWRDVNDSWLYLGGSSSDSNGAFLTLYGKDHATAGGTFNLKANDGTNSAMLTGHPNGALTWGGKNVERVYASGTNYIRYESGVQICWGHTTATTAGTTVSFGVAFKDTNYIVVDQAMGATLGAGISDKTTTNVKIMSSHATTNAAVEWIAIGLWK